LYNKVLPPTLKADNPDPKLGVESSPFYLNTTARPWFTKNDHPRRSGVSSFGFGGSNFHVVLEEYQREKKEIAWDGSVEILAFSGPDARTITDGLHQIDSRLEDPVDPSLLSRTARASRTRFSAGHPCRLVMVVDTAGDLKDAEEQFQSAIDLVTAGKSTVLSAEGIYFVAARQPAGKIAFMFPGQGSQYPAMGKDLTCCFPGAMALWKLSAGSLTKHRPWGKSFFRALPFPMTSNRRRPFAGQMWPSPPSVRSAWPCYRFWRTLICGRMPPADTATVNCRHCMPPDGSTGKPYCI
jgi:acyl transferase domain-containing protein